MTFIEIEINEPNSMHKLAPSIIFAQYISVDKVSYNAAYVYKSHRSREKSLSMRKGLRLEANRK